MHLEFDMYPRERKKNLQVNFKKTLFNEEKWKEQDKQATDDAKAVLVGCFWLFIALSVVVDLHCFRAIQKAGNTDFSRF